MAEVDYTPPVFKRVGCYSVDEERQFIDGPECIQFCENFEGIREVHYDLNVGFDLEAIKYHDRVFIQDRKKVSFSHLLNWIRLHETEFDESRPHFVIRRSVLKDVLATPYADPKKREWEISAMLKNGTIYIRSILNTTDKAYANQERPIQAWRSKAWGHSFENTLLSDEPLNLNQPPSQQLTLKTKEFCGIFRGEVGKHSILFAAALDGITTADGDPREINPKQNPNDFFDPKCLIIDVKCEQKSRLGDGMRTDLYFRRIHTRKSWFHGVLSGVSNQFAGYRNDEGIVRQVQNIPLNDLPTIHAMDWVPRTGFSFLEEFLTMAKGEVIDENIEYVFSYSPRRIPMTADDAPVLAADADLTYEIVLARVERSGTLPLI